MSINKITFDLNSSSVDVVTMGLTSDNEAALDLGNAEFINDSSTGGVKLNGNNLLTSQNILQTTEGDSSVDTVSQAALKTASHIGTIVITQNMITGYGTGAVYGNPWYRFAFGVNDPYLINDKYDIIKLDITAIRAILGIPTNYLYAKRNATNSDQGITLYQFDIADTGFDYSHITDPITPGDLSSGPYVQVAQIGDAALIYEPTTGTAWITNRNISPTYLYSAVYELEINKQDKLGFDSSGPVEDSSNILTSGVIYNTLGEYAKIDGYYSNMGVGEADFAKSIKSDRQIDNPEIACPPITFGTAGGKAEIETGINKFTTLYGNSIVWNQLLQNGDFSEGTANWYARSTTRTSISVNDGILSHTFLENQEYTGSNAYRYGLQQDCTIIAGHKYLLRGKIKSPLTGVFTCEMGEDAYPNPSEKFNAVANEWVSFAIIVPVTVNKNKIILYPYSIALSQGDVVQYQDICLFDLTKMYNVNNEPTVPDDFISTFTSPYYAYNQGVLISSNSSSFISIGKNQCRGLNAVSGETYSQSDFIKVVPGIEYELSGISNGGYIYEYDLNKNLLSQSGEITQTTNITLSPYTQYVKIEAETFSNVMFYITWGVYNEPYEAFTEQTVTLPGIELRSIGLLKDEAYAGGGGIRNIGKRAYQPGDENNPNYVTDGVNTLYPLNTPINISNNENPGWIQNVFVDNFGTLEFTSNVVQNPVVPQAYFIIYTISLVEFLDSLYMEASGDADNLSTYEGIEEWLGTNGYTPNVIPALPSGDGTYTLKVTISSGVVTYSWVLDT